jgi:hypothetical protein
MRMRMGSLLAAALEELVSTTSARLISSSAWAKSLGCVQRAERREPNQISFTPMPLNVVH